MVERKEGLRLGKPEVLPRKNYVPVSNTDWHSEDDCEMNYQGQSDDVRSWFCESHHQWAYNYGAIAGYIFPGE